MDSSNSESDLAKEALAFFFRAMSLHKAHWYSLYHPTDDNNNNIKKIYECFPSLSSVLCIEEGIMLKMLTTGGLARSSEKRGVTTNLFSWESFLKEFMLDVEVSHFYIFKKRRLLVRFGSWDNAVHPKKKPAEIWSASLKNSLKLPRLRISSLLKDVAAKVGEIASITQAAFETESDEGQESDSGVGSDSNNDSESESSVDLESEHRSGSDQGDSELVGLLVNTNIPDVSLFPLLHSLCIDSDSKMDCLIQEIIKFHGAKTVKFTSRNNRPGSLLIMPCLRNIKRYDN